MFKYVIGLLMGFHSLIHFIGFAKAFEYRNIPVLSAISRPMGVLWFITAILFIAAIISLLTGHSSWWMFALTATLISELVIINSWQDAKMGTIINMLVLLMIVCWKFFV